MENLKAETRAGVLVEALPYLQEYKQRCTRGTNKIKKKR